MSKSILIAEKVLPISSPPLDGYAVIIEGDTIIDVETIPLSEKKHPNAKRIDFGRATIMPGLINLHTHLELSGLKGCFPEGIDFFEWIPKLIERKARMTKKEYEDGVLIGIEEMIRTGTTSVGEITSEGISPYITRSNGIRCKVFYEVIGLSDLYAGYIWFRKRREINRFRNSDLIHAGVSPHSCYSLSYRLMKKVSDYSSEHGVSLSSHISETEEEAEFIRNGGGRIKELLDSLGFTAPLPFHSASPTLYFKDLGLLKRDFVAAHAVWVDERDIEIMRESMLSIAHCPRSNAYLNVGKAPTMKFLKEGINVGIGTDSLASNNNLNMWDEMRMAYRLHRDEGMTPHEILKMVTVNGARALGFEDKVGSLEIGKKADIIAVRTPEGAGDDIYSDLLRETSEVLLTMVSGKVLYQKERYWN